MAATPLPKTVAGYEELSRKLFPRSQFEMLFGTYGDPEWPTYNNNLDGFGGLCLRPRVLVDVSRRNLTTEVLGQRVSLPVLLDPIGPQTFAHPEGELATARAAGAAGTVMALSTASSYSLDKVAEVATGPLWFQLFVFKDHSLAEYLVRRAEAAGYRGLAVTVTLQVAQPRTHDIVPYAATDMGLSHFAGLDRPNVPTLHGMIDGFDQALTWKDLKWLRSLTSMPLIVKGIQTAEDARLCIEYGVDAIIVSNHGGRSLQAARATIEALPEIASEAGDRLEVYLDGGVRRGTDVLIALALGARAVLIGRPMIWGLSVAGEAGVRGVIEVLRTELDGAMAQTGVTDVRDVERSLVTKRGAGLNASRVDPEPVLR